METRKLYYEDCHRKTFSARVVDCRETQKGWIVTLDATAFYPEGGGQACDTGVLVDARVTDVRERDGQVEHLCDRPLPVGETVEGAIYYDRRFSMMQQHTGEHILSGLIHQRFGWHNVGFHMGADVVTVDFDGPIPVDALAELEREANEAIWQNIPLRIWTPTPEELPHVVYRTKRALPWPVRIVQVPGYDSCACCGVHTETTGEVGLLKIFSCVKFHDGVRIEMACGRLALARLAAVYEQNRQVSQAFSAQILETGAAARKMNEALAAEKYRAAGLEKRLCREIKNSYVNRNTAIHFESQLSPGGVRELADQLAEVCRDFAAVFSGDDEQGYSFCMVSRSGDLRPLGKAMTQSLHGRGGGKPECQQGSVKAARQEIEAFFAEK